MIKQFKTRDLVEIKWIDSIHESGWNFLNDQDWADWKNKMHHLTVGYIVHQNADQLIVVQSIGDYVYPSGNQSIDSVMAIPVMAIKKVTKIRSWSKEVNGKKS